MDLRVDRRGCESVVLDFDGTMCLLFQNHDLAATRHRMHEELGRFSIDFDEALDAFDAFDAVLAQTADRPETRAEALLKADEILSDAEVAAAGTGPAVTGVAEAVDFWRGAGYRVGVATNNSARAVDAFLSRMSIRQLPVVGRDGAHPERLKPSTWSVERVLELMGGRPEATVFVGDTRRDYETSLRAGCAFLGMVPTERKRGAAQRGPGRGPDGAGLPRAAEAVLRSVVTGTCPGAQTEPIDRMTSPRSTLLSIGSVSARRGQREGTASAQGEEGAGGASTAVRVASRKRALEFPCCPERGQRPRVLFVESRMRPLSGGTMEVRWPGRGGGRWARQ